MASPAATRSAPAANDEGEAVPSRIVVAIDGLDQLPAAAAAEFLEVGHRLLARPHFVTIVAVQRGHLAAGFSETDPALAASKIDRCVQLSYDLGAESFAPGLLAGRLLDAGAPIAAPDHAGDAQSAGLDRPWQAYETELVTALAAFAGSTPRSVKRFVNTYRVARADPRLDAATPAEFGGLALGLALDGSGVGAELTGLEAEAEDGQPQAQSQGELARALAAARQASGRAFTPAEARLGLQVARSYGRRG
jgi:hypothetical protein